MRMLLPAVFTLVLLIAGSCRVAKKPEVSGRWEEVVVDDSGWISGCAMTLRTVSGQVLVPVALPINDSLSFAPQDRWRVRVEAAKEPVYACTLLGAPVRILEARRIRSGRPPGTGGIKPAPRLCAWTIDAYSVPWMEQVIRQLDPDRITRYRWLGGGAYLFESTRGDYLFDCQGELICQSPSGSGDCAQRPELEEAYIILVRNY